MWVYHTYNFHTCSCLGRLHAVHVAWGNWTYYLLVLTWVHCAQPAHFWGDHLYLQPCQARAQAKPVMVQPSSNQTSHSWLISAYLACYRIVTCSDCHLSLGCHLNLWLGRHLPKCSCQVPGFQYSACPGWPAIRMMAPRLQQRFCSYIGHVQAIILSCSCARGEGCWWILWLVMIGIDFQVIQIELQRVYLEQSSMQ